MKVYGIDHIHDPFGNRIEWMECVKPVETTAGNP
jgi:hypothetical protein